MSDSRLNFELANASSELIFDNSRATLKKNERIILSLLAIAGFIGLLYLGHCKALVGKHDTHKCQMFKNDLSLEAPITTLSSSNS